MTHQQPSVERLRELFVYEADTGRLVWRIHAGKCGRGRAGSNAGTVRRKTDGRLAVSISGSAYYLHRIAWAMQTGNWPADRIDHIDRNAANNRWENLRECTARINAQNRRSSCKSKTGLLGVVQRGKRFEARIKTGGKTYELGRFDTAEAAYTAYVVAKRRLHEGCTL